MVKLGLTVGGALPQVREAGWALVFQEFGHALGTLARGLPLALLLGIKREAVGATFSVGREGNLVIIGEKYGMASAEGRGVLAEYITGTVLGALFIAVLAGFVTSLHIFDPLALAMGAGVGSGSMMAAAIGAIAAQQPESMRAELTAIAAASNLLTNVVGFYFTLFLSLPLCSFLYERLEPVLGRFSKRQPVAQRTTAARIDEVEQGPAPRRPARGVGRDDRRRDDRQPALVQGGAADDAGRRAGDHRVGAAGIARQEAGAQDADGAGAVDRGHRRRHSGTAAPSPTR